jgi:sugar lactone lactonase YvrE
MHSKHRLLAAALFLAAVPAFADNRPNGDSKLFAPVPAPGYPEGIAVRGHRAYVAGPAAFGLTAAPVVFEFNTNTGALTRQFPITISNPFAGIRAASCLAFGEDGKLYVIEPFVGIIRMNLDNANTQSVYATFPPSQNSLLNDLAFDDNGNLFVTDSFAGIIYRVPAGGGAAQVWFQDPRLLGNPELPFGVNGIRIDKQGKRIYFSVTVRNDFSGAIYSLPLSKAPTAAQLTEVHVYPSTPATPVPAPDGIAFANNNKLYVTLAGSSQISVLNSSGNEIRLYSAPANGVPWANPANIAFDDDHDRILVTNHASLVPFDPSLFLVFDVAVNDKGLQLP